MYFSFSTCCCRWIILSYRLPILIVGRSAPADLSLTDWLSCEALFDSPGDIGGRERILSRFFIASFSSDWRFLLYFVVVKVKLICFRSPERIFCATVTWKFFLCRWCNAILILIFSKYSQWRILEENIYICRPWCLYSSSNISYFCVIKSVHISRTILYF